MNLATPSAVREIINKYGFRLRKSLGQNFLIDANVRDKIVAASGVDADCGALEIGPGIGALTQGLAAAAKKVVAVEIDKALPPVLTEVLSGCENVKIICGDIMKIDLRDLIASEFGGMPVRVAANLPYYITTPVIMKLLEDAAPIKSITVMVQKEVAERMTAAPGGKDYGALSVAVRYRAKPRILFHVEQSCFMPQPKVASAVIRLDVMPEPAAAVKSEELFFAVVRAAFGQRRKTLVNALLGGGVAGLDKAELEKIVDFMGLPPAVRGEALSVAEFGELSNMIFEKSVDKT